LEINQSINYVIGLIVYSILLVPYESWRVADGTTDSEPKRKPLSEVFGCLEPLACGSSFSRLSFFLSFPFDFQVFIDFGFGLKRIRSNSIDIKLSPAMIVNLAVLYASAWIGISWIISFVRFSHSFPLPFRLLHFN
jgi:hypothetical protein